MDYNNILKILAPCGLNCEKCMGFYNGLIKKHSIELKNLLGSFDQYAKRFSEFIPVFKNYPQFKELLDFLTQGDCPGCRSGACRYPDCGVIKCYQEKGVDFCFQCDEFPCDKTNFDPDLKQRWLSMNKRMQEIGVEGYYEETKNLPRYK
ncbi:DUF3795 domain-containing protein [candidate division KSB1 bacterium]|nr:DUF3795 domain-containing protein [candidate division KSB1 bacterium]